MGQVHFVEDRLETLEKVCADPRLQVRVRVRVSAGNEGGPKLLRLHTMPCCVEGRASIE